MPDYSLDPRSTLVFGRKGTGKSSFAFRYLLNRATEQPGNDAPAGCTFIFDYKLEAHERLGLPLCGTAAQCEAALATRWVCFNPRVMFPPSAKENFDQSDARAFRWFCHWLFQVCQRGPGNKVLFVDEMRRFVPSRSDLVPWEVDQIFREGRAVGLETVLATQYPRDYSKNIREEVSEWVCFNINEPDNLEAVRPYFPTVDRVASLPRGSYLAYNRESGAELAGKLF
jgi:DNA helicase HerA-like ATPase